MKKKNRFYAKGFAWVTCLAMPAGLLFSQDLYTYASYGGNQKHNSKIITHTQTTEVGEAKQTLQSALMELSKKKGIYFLLSDQNLSKRAVNAVSDFSEETELILKDMLKNTGLLYKKINDKTIVIQQVKDTDKKGLTGNLTVNTSLLENEKIEYSNFDIIKGTVKGSDGQTLSGASVTIRGTAKGVSTNAKGEFSINAKPTDVLIISYIGYEAKEISVGTNATLNIVLNVEKQNLSEVTVTTALGIQRKSKDLTYATQTINNADLTTVKDPNFINSLSGKVAGVSITKSASGLGGSSRVVLRGNKSTRENQPLYVVDGVPLTNYNPSQPADVWGQASGQGSSGRDGGDGISNINPDDIESVTILKGASGAALYGSAAANGAIIITTKSGKAGKTRITVSSEVTLEKPIYYPQMQFKYGQTGIGTSGYDPTAEGSWGSVVNAPNHTTSFFQTGTTYNNSISLTGGTEKAQTYFSYANVHSDGIMPTSSFDRNNFNFRETAKFLNDKLLVDANIMFLTQTANNRPVSGLYANPLTGLYIFPRGLNFNTYKNNYQYYSATRNMNLQNWFDLNFDKGLNGQDHEQNPYWILNNMPRVDKRNRAITNLSLKYKLNDWLNIQARGNFDKTYDVYDSRMYAGTQSVQAAPNGRYTYDNSSYTQMYGDVILNANKHLNSNWDLNASLGASINDTKLEDVQFDTDPTATSGLYYANKFGVNYIMSDALVSNQSLAHKQQQAIFANAQFSYKNYLYFDVTGRNDWSSTFAFTPTKNSGYFYYSAGANFILSQALKMPSYVSFSKVRISYAKVGNDVPVYITNPSAFTMNNRFGAQFNTKVPYPGSYLQPEDNRSFEIGTEWRFAQDRLGIDLTYYKNNNYRQYMEVNAPLGSGYSTYYLNLGNIQNTGFEAVVFAVPVQTKTTKWTTTFNFASNVNKVVKLSDANIAGAGPTNPLIITGAGVNMYQSQIIEGGSWGDIYGYTFQRNPSNGTILVDATGAPLKSSSLSYVGNPNPKFTLGWNNSVNVKNFTISLLIDGRFGGKVMSVTQAVLDGYGASAATAAARDAGGVNIQATNSVTNQPWSGLLPTQAFYQGVGGRAGISEYYMYDATAVRLREVAVTYKLPVHIKGVNDVKLALIGRNLFFISKNAPFDPEISMATNNALQGIETFGIPSTRSIGGSIKISF